MLRINLLPEELRQSTASPIEQFHRTPLFLVIIVGILGILPLVFWAPIGLRRQQLRQLQSKVALLEPKKLVVDQLQRDLQLFRAQEAAFQGMIKGQGLWAARLNTLSDAIPDGVWFTELILEDTKLVIHGSAISLANPGMVSVTNLVQGLKADAHFMAAVKDIQIESMKRVQEGEVEVTQFIVNCALVEVPAA